jgi:hypothetical protein
VVEVGLEPVDVGHGDVVEGTRGAGPDRHDLLLDRERCELLLLEQLDQAGSALERTLGGAVEVGTECGERFQLAILRQVEAQTPGHRTQRPDLCGAADPRHGHADVDGGSDTRVEQVGLEKI